MTAYSFSPVRKYALVGGFFAVLQDARMSVSEFTENASGRITVAVALERRSVSGWRIDSEFAFEQTFAADAEDWKRNWTVSDFMETIHKAIVGHTLPMGHHTYQAPR